jgi:hypothetical protein
VTEIPPRARMQEFLKHAQKFLDVLKQDDSDEDDEEDEEEDA